MANEATSTAAMTTTQGSRAPAVVAVTATMISLSTAFVTLRFISRAGIVKRVSADDYVILLAWILAFGLSFTICYSTKFGLGMHESEIPAGSRMELSKLEYTFTVLYNPALMATKTSIGIFYLTLAKEGTQRIFKWLTIGTMFIVNVAGLALSLLCIFQCTPLSSLFAQVRPPNTHCIDIVTLYLSSAPVNIATDIFLLLLPMPLLKSMRLPRKQKIILYVTFGFGVFIAVVDVIRISYLQQASITRLRDILLGQQRDQQTAQIASDFSWYASLTFLWSAIEVNVGIMCACVPALKPLVSKVMPHMLKDAASGTSPEKSGTFNSSQMRDAHHVPSAPVSPLTATAPQFPPPAQRRSDSDEMGFMDFLTSPDMVNEAPGGHGLERSDTVMTIDTTRRRSINAFYDFIDIPLGKSMLQFGNRESIRPIAEVTVLFFLWGFAYGLLNTLNSQFQIVARMTTAQTVGIHSSYYAAYAFGPSTFGRIVLKRWGFKACYMVGLIIYGTGTLVFWPAGVLTSFPAFLVSNIITGLGISILELGANPFITLIGPPEYGEMRLNLSQGIQAIGTVVSPLLAKKALFGNIVDPASLVDVQWTYLAISIFTFLLAFVYYVAKIPEVTDQELEESAWETHPNSLEMLRAHKVPWITLIVCAIGQFIYVGVQETVAVTLQGYINEVSGGTNVVDYEAIGHTLFAVSRLLAAVSGFLVKPRFQLLVCTVASIIFSALAMHLKGKAGVSMVLMVYFFEGPIFPLLFAIPLRGMGKYTKDSAALITAAISGGAAFAPIIQYTGKSEGYMYAYCVPVALFAALTVVALYLNVYPLATKQIDPVERSGRPRNYSEAASSAFRKFSQMSHISHVSHIHKRHTKGKDGNDASSGEAASQNSATAGQQEPRLDRIDPL